MNKIPQHQPMRALKINKLLWTHSLTYGQARFVYQKLTTDGYLHGIPFQISMPLDSTIPQETPVVACQVGGRQLGADSLLWRTLFPSGLLRIDGRVPVDKSAQYLLQMRMNSAKELIAVALSAASPSDTNGYKTLSEYLVGKK